MNSKYIKIDENLIELEPVAESENSILYRYTADDRICGAPIGEVVKRFPNYRPSREDLACDYLFEENGEIQYYGPDGELVDGLELITEEEINKTE